ncbi:MAG: phosphoribosylglycinamide formyltransferase [Betaproteobacteria bacterium]|jgi:phosphoribosylglycinamide formyltransferase-1
MTGIVVLISGRGSNMQALLTAGLPVRAVVSNRPGAGGLATARAQGIATEIVDHQTFRDRDSFDAALRQTVERYSPDLVVLAGFLRVLTPRFVEAFSGRLINIHPSLLPAFPGLDTHRRALDAGVKLHGCTVHFVTLALDQGPIIAQAAVPVLDDDSEDTLAARVLRQEHLLLPASVQWFLDGQLHVNGARVSGVSGNDLTTALRVPPTP